MGSSSPASVMTPKYRIANTNIAATGRGLLQTAQDELSGLSSPKPASDRGDVGTTISATSGDMRRLMISASRQSDRREAEEGQHASATARRVRPQA